MARHNDSRPRFDRDTFRFLADLAAHNDRAWFAANKPRYEAHVAAPALAFIEAFARPLADLSRHFRAVPKRTGGSLMRVYRDTRFGKDKTPYKTNVGIQFRHERGRDVHAPGYYIHVEPGECFLGAGIWRPEPSALTAIRLEIAERPQLWQTCVDDRGFKRYFELAGERLTRLPRNIASDAPHGDDLRRKDFIAICSLSDNQVVRADFPEWVAARFGACTALMRFLCGALDLAF